MNATPTNPSDFTEEHVDGSDSDTNIDEDDTSEYYQPISVLDDSDSENSDPINSNGYEAYGGDRNDAVEYHPSSQLSNGHHVAESGMSSLDLNNDAEQSNSISEYEGEEMTREAPDSAIMRAFREDENRRNAPLTPENAMRIREAMRGISFGGATPDWVERVPEDGWIDRLRRLRQSSQA